MPNRVGTASWDEKRQLWRIDVTNEQGKRKSFTSAKPGRTGQRIANAKADEWLASGVAVPSSRVEELYVQWIQERNAHHRQKQLSAIQADGKIMCNH